MGEIGGQKDEVALHLAERLEFYRKMSESAFKGWARQIEETRGAHRGLARLQRRMKKITMEV